MGALVSGIGWGGPEVCTACRTLMHAPTPACPEPHVCLTGDECPTCRERRYHDSTAWGR